ncbi:nucleolin [Drosophila teissieri]|uniref:nucleolin n=1 Tax=Drosophila teissieri TaxID=7243 RepID=UPI001CB9FE8B|nr:nucleolin [Drosophila teissieri]
MKKKQVESASEEEEVQAEDSEASEEEELQAADSDEEELEAENSDEEELEAEDSEEEELEAEDSDGSELDLDASATESDEDDDEEEEQVKPEPKSRAEIIDEKIHTKYEQLKGTRLYVRFPQKLPLNVEEFNAKVKALHPLVLKSTKPRQKHARFCLVDFKSKEDRDQAFKEIKASIEKDEKHKGLFVSLPKTDSDDFVNELVTRKQTSVENKRTKALMKRATKKVLVKGNFTSSVVITNLPKTSSIAQVRQLFQDAVDIQIRPGKGKFRDYSTATVTLPTTHDARKAIKEKLSLAGTPLVLRFNTQKKRSSKDKLKRQAENGKSPEKKARSPKQNDKKSKAEEGKAPKNKRPEKDTKQQPKGNLKRKAPKEKTPIIKTPKKLKKLSAE